MFKRSSGILMHISSLPNNQGIGTFGKEAYKFADFVKACGFSYWQILPLNPTGYGDSPYQSFSSFAGNPYFIDLYNLVDLELLTALDVESSGLIDENERFVDYGKVYSLKPALLKLAYKNSGFLKQELEAFKEENSEWLEDYSLFAALKEHFLNIPWTEWENGIKHRKSEELERYKILLKDEIDFYSFTQYLFFTQWKKLKDYVNSLGIKIIGDIPIYVSLDSADAWCGKDFLQLDKNLLPVAVAGVPPDYFSKTGQLWGNPLYDWKKLKESNYDFWVKRVNAANSLYDIIRIDHFRGFINYWKVPFGEKDAVNGVWEDGPNISVFNEIKNKCGDVKIIAEDLGVFDERIEILRKKLNFPGMKVLQFGYEGDKESPHTLENVKNDNVYYIGTHDNDTLMGWYKKLSKENKKHLKEVFKLNNKGINFKIINGALSSAADLVIIPMQDILGLDSKCRMNTPSTTYQNWKWRALNSEFFEETADIMFKLIEISNRLIN